MNDQGRLEARIVELEAILKDAVIISDAGASTVHVGSVVTLKDVEYGDVEDYLILGENEFTNEENYISAESPAGKALIGSAPGDVVKYEAP